MEQFLLVAGLYLVCLCFFAAALARGAAGSSKAMLAWLALWPLLIGGYIYGAANHGFPSGRGIAGLVIVGLSLVLALLLVYRSGRVSVALFALVSVLPMALFVLAGPKGL